MLSTAFENMTMNMREHTKLQHRLAYFDSMTGLRNTTAYKEWIIDFDKNIYDERSTFGVVVLDINNLKATNDSHGHHIGNRLITTVARLVSSTFKRSPVFRVGGDEFVVILQGRDLEEVEALFYELDMEFKNAHIEVGATMLPISVARGFAEFDPARDSRFEDVFNRADDRMYENKKEMKMLGR
jgi:diguanylate cyclase (GGDEF)-like protein